MYDTETLHPVSADPLRNSYDKRSQDRNESFEKKPSSNFNRQNSAYVYLVDQQEKQTKLRRLPEYSKVRFIIFPDDNFKLYWDILIFL